MYFYAKKLEKHCPSIDGIYVCVIWNLVECRNNRDYNTQVAIKIKRKNDNQSRLAQA
jgi:hypothetical protein|tara:strand:- start:258 stop:428 length:171 start_codon:yes stop_codon:yes gene_type:complete